MSDFPGVIRARVKDSTRISMCANGSTLHVSGTQAIWLPKTYWGSGGSTNAHSYTYQYQECAGPVVRNFGDYLALIKGNSRSWIQERLEKNSQPGSVVHSHPLDLKLGRIRCGDFCVSHLTLCYFFVIAETQSRRR